MSQLHCHPAGAIKTLRLFARQSRCHSIHDEYVALAGACMRIGKAYGQVVLVGARLLHLVLKLQLAAILTHLETICGKLLDGKLVQLQQVLRLLVLH